MKTKPKTKKVISPERARMEAAAELFPELLAEEDRPARKIKRSASLDGLDLETAVDDEDAYPSDFNIVKLMEESEDPDTGLIRDLKIDDRDLKSARNYWDYCYNIIGKDAHPPWLIQMWIAVMLFAEVCPVCSDKRWLNLEYVVDKIDRSMSSELLPEHMVLLKNGTCPKCKRHKYELINEWGLHNYSELVNVLGQRSGKSSSAASMSSYVAHRYLKFPKMATLTNSMQKSTELTGTFVSLTFSKAEALLWTPFINLINESSWYTEFHAMLDHYGAKYGVELYRKKDLFIKYYHKGLKFYPTHPNGNILRGDTRILAVIDELGLFPLPSGDDEEDEQSARANADEAHKSLTNSLVTVQAAAMVMLKQGFNPPPALMMGVSSPISMRDKVMRLLADSRTPEGSKYILGVNLPTWKVNPHIERDTPIIALAYARNPEKAERDFGANPPRVHSAFVPRSAIKYELFNQAMSHQLRYVYDQPGFLYARLEPLKLGQKFPSIVCVDAGSVNNSFTLVAAHYNFDTSKTEVSTVLECMPHEGRRIDFNLIYQYVILPLCRETNAVALLADQWQSMDILHRAKADMGNLPDGKPRCLAKQYSPRRSDFDMLVSMMHNDNLLLPRLPEPQFKAVMEGEVYDFRTLNGKPMQHLVLQMTTVRNLGEGKCPGKGEGFTDDTFRSLVLVTKIHEPRVMDRLVEARKHGVGGAGRSNPTPVVLGRSGNPGYMRR